MKDEFAIIIVIDKIYNNIIYFINNKFTFITANHQIQFNSNRTK